jgi:hypothetical protein
MWLQSGRVMAKSVGQVFGHLPMLAEALPEGLCSYLPAKGGTVSSAQFQGTMMASKLDKYWDHLRVDLCAEAVINSKHGM